MTEAEAPAVWGLPALDGDTLASVATAIQASAQASTVAAMSVTCREMAIALKADLRARKRQQLRALTGRLGWNVDDIHDLQILHSTSQSITDSELLLLCSFLFSEEEAARAQRVAPLLDHLNLGSNRFGDRGLLGLIDAATRAPRERLTCLSLSGNMIGDAGASALAHAIEVGCAFPGLQMLSMGGNARLSTVGEAALRGTCGACSVSVRGVGVLRGAPIVKQPMQGSWVVRVAVDSDDATRSSVTRATSSGEYQAAFARGVRERAVARRDPLIAPDARLAESRRSLDALQLD